MVFDTSIKFYPFQYRIKFNKKLIILMSPVFHPKKKFVTTYLMNYLRIIKVEIIL